MKVDLHTHSDASPDGGITFEQYVRILDHEILDCIAVTDHNTIERAQELRQALGSKIIIGEEITTLSGDIIGLFLDHLVAPEQSLEATVAAIKKQGGLVYVPHPFETVRKGLPEASLEHIAKDIDIMEVFNARAFVQNRGPKAITWARLNSKPGAASSDAHGMKGLGTAYSVLKEKPNRKNLVELLTHGHCEMQRPPLISLLYPKAHRVLNKFKKP